MQAGLASLIAAAGEVFERDFMGAGEVIVQREGHSRVQHVFTVNGRAIARLRWHGLRRAAYEADGSKWDIKVGALGKRISIISEDGGVSLLVERSRANPNKEGLRIEMAEGDNFCLKRSWDSRLRAEASFVVNKEFYCSRLLVFHFNMRHRTQTTARVLVNPVMKWEARFVHRFLALSVCRIILERRYSGSKPLQNQRDEGPAVYEQRPGQRAEANLRLQRDAFRGKLREIKWQGVERGLCHKPELTRSEERERHFLSALR